MLSASAASIVVAPPISPAELIGRYVYLPTADGGYACRVVQGDDAPTLRSRVWGWLRGCGAVAAEAFGMFAPGVLLALLVLLLVAMFSGVGQPDAKPAQPDAVEVTP